MNKMMQVTESLRLHGLNSLKQSAALGCRGLATSGQSGYIPADPEKLEWSKLGFSYVPTKTTLILNHKDGKWDSEFTHLSEPFVQLHVLANVLHYGQAIFEGLKAFHHQNGDIVLFNPKANANRMQQGAKRLGMPVLPEDVFVKGCAEVVKANKRYVPPFGTGGALYIRPFFFGAGAQLGLGKAKEYIFGVISSPVGLYYPSGLKPVDALIVEEYDRAAPKGVGNVKVAGNYAADIVPAAESQAKGFPISLYLDAKEGKYVEEFSTSNFIGIDKAGNYVTPDSLSVLPSITNMMLQKLAQARGIPVVKRKITYEELKRGDFKEVAACGTAVIVTPVKSITKGNEKIKISEKLTVLEKLYDELRDIQAGKKKESFGWCVPVCKRD